MPLAFPDLLGQAVVLHPFDSLRGFGVQYLGDISATFSATAAWPAANRAIAMPLYLESPLAIEKAWWHNGTTINGNVDVGIYTAAYARITSTGSTAHSGSGVIQSATLSVTLQPGTYFLAMASSSGTATFGRANPAAVMLRTYAMFQMASAMALPSTLTPATIASAFLPFVGLTARSVL